MDMVVKRHEVYLVSLDPTVGGEIKKARPCLVVSPDEMNAHISTVIVAPMTTGRPALPYTHCVPLGREIRVCGAGPVADGRQDTLDPAFGAHRPRCSVTGRCSAG